MTPCLVRVPGANPSSVSILRFGNPACDNELASCSGVGTGYFASKFLRTLATLVFSAAVNEFSNTNLDLSPVNNSPPAVQRSLLLLKV